MVVRASGTRRAMPKVTSKIAALAVTLALTAMLLALFALAGCGGRKPATTRPPAPALKAPQPGAKPGTRTVALYFSTMDARGLFPETRQVTVAETGKDATSQAGKAATSQAENVRLATAIVLELVKGPEAGDLYPTLPRSTKVLSVRWEAPDQVMQVDLSQEFVDRSPGAEQGELLAVYSIVNSVCAIPSVRAVRFLIDGRAITTLKGFADLTEPVTPDLNMLAR